MISSRLIERMTIDRDRDPPSLWGHVPLGAIFHLTSINTQTSDYHSPADITAPWFSSDTLLLYKSVNTYLLAYLLLRPSTDPVG